jgi:hypothetical protein
MSGSPSSKHFTIIKMNHRCRTSSLRLARPNFVTMRSHVTHFTIVITLRDKPQQRLSPRRVDTLNLRPQWNPNIFLSVFNLRSIKIEAFLLSSFLGLGLSRQTGGTKMIFPWLIVVSLELEASLSKPRSHLSPRAFENSKIVKLDTRSMWNIILRSNQTIYFMDKIIVFIS